MSEKKEKSIRIRQKADEALDDMVAGEIDLSKREIASRAILSYHRAWKARRTQQTA